MTQSPFTIPPVLGDITQPVLLMCKPKRARGKMLLQDYDRHRIAPQGQHEPESALIPAICCVMFIYSSAREDVGSPCGFLERVHTAAPDNSFVKASFKTVLISSLNLKRRV